MVLRYEWKEDFKKSGHAKAFRDFVDSPAFTAGVAAALQHYGDSITCSLQDGESRFYRIVGAREVLGVLLNLTETVETPKTTVLQNLQRV